MVTIPTLALLFIPLLSLPPMHNYPCNLLTRGGWPSASKLVTDFKINFNIPSHYLSLWIIYSILFLESCGCVCVCYTDRLQTVNIENKRAIVQQLWLFIASESEAQVMFLHRIFSYLDGCSVRVHPECWGESVLLFFLLDLVRCADRCWYFSFWYHLKVPNEDSLFILGQ